MIFLRRAFEFLAGSPFRGCPLPVSVHCDYVISDPAEAINVGFEAAARKALPPAHWGYLSTGVDDDANSRPIETVFLIINCARGVWSIPQNRYERRSFRNEMGTRSCWRQRNAVPSGRPAARRARRTEAENASNSGRRRAKSSDRRVMKARGVRRVSNTRRKIEMTTEHQTHRTLGCPVPVDRRYRWPQPGNGPALPAFGHASVFELPYDRSSGSAGPGRPQYSDLRNAAPDKRPDVDEDSCEGNRES